MKRAVILATMLYAVVIVSAPGSAAQPLILPPDAARSLYVLAHVDVTEEHTRPAMAAIRICVEAARREPGAMRLEAMQETRPNHFDIIEVWRDDAAYQAHEASPATISFHDAIAPWREVPSRSDWGRS